MSWFGGMPAASTTPSPALTMPEWSRFCSAYEIISSVESTGWNGRGVTPAYSAIRRYVRSWGV